MILVRQYMTERNVAEQSVARVAKVTKRVQSSVKGLSKADATPVTAADYAIQALLISGIMDVFPEDDIVGEEDAGALRRNTELTGHVWEIVASARTDAREQGYKLPTPRSVDDMLEMIDRGGNGRGGRSGRFWVMDPIDGTASFLRGEQYAISLALIEDGRQVVGVLACPNVQLRDGRIFEDSVDLDGLGVMMSVAKDQRVLVRWLTSADVASVPATMPDRLTSPPDTKHYHLIDTTTSTTSRHDIIGQLADKLGARYPGTDVWSSHVRYAALIVGGGDFFVRIPNSTKSKSYIWDHAGAQLIFAELGGKITDLDGKSIDFGAGRTLAENRGLVAARGDIHDSIFNMVTELLAQRAV